MEVSGSKPDRSAAAYESIDNMVKKNKKIGVWGSESESDDDDMPFGQSESDCEEEDPMGPIWNLIYEDDSNGLMKYLNLAQDGNDGLPADADGNDCDPEQLKYAFQSSCYLNKLSCLQALLDSKRVDWFNVVGEEYLLHDICVKDTKDAAQLVIKYAKEKKLLDKLLGARDGLGITPLHFATFCGSRNVMRLLLKEGADPCMQDGKHKLPCDYAHPGTKDWMLLVNAVLNKVKSN